MKLIQVIGDGTAKGTVIGIFHTFLILLAYVSPFLFGWYWIALGVVVFWIEIHCLGNCILHASQYGDSESGVFKNLLFYLGLSFNPKKLRFYLLWIAPLIILATGVVSQVIFDLHPLLI